VYYCKNEPLVYFVFPSLRSTAYIMVAAAAFPLAKLGILLVKQISKPLANSITSRARKSKVFRDYFCIPMAQFFHWADVKIRMRILNLGKVQTVPKLDEKKAIETGAQVCNEDS